MRILVVEDEVKVAKALKEGLEDERYEAVVAHTGEDAFFRINTEQFDVILLDLNLPKKDGREVLAELKDDPVLRRIPVVVLTTSRAPLDRDRSYDLHANAYVTKPVDFERFVEVIRQIDEFFISVVPLP